MKTIYNEEADEVEVHIEEGETIYVGEGERRIRVTYGFAGERHPFAVPPPEGPVAIISVEKRQMHITPFASNVIQVHKAGD